MANLKGKVKNALNEGRTLVLGAQVLIGFQYQSIFQKSFEKLPEITQYLKVSALGLMLVALALLMWPVAYHRIVEKGEDTQQFHDFVTCAISPALLPFAIGLGIDLYIAAEKLGGQTVGIICGIAGTVAALVFWYGIEAVYAPRRERERRERGSMENPKPESEQKDDGNAHLQDKIEQVLTETRVVLPGAQALLGFQFAAFLMEPFDKLPASSKIIHLICLALIALCTILLMTPAAYHRLVEKGEDSEEFHTFVSRMVLASMVPLALGLSGDFYVVVAKVFKSVEVGIMSAVCMLLLFLGLWFGYTLVRKAQREKQPSAVPQVQPR
jgi:protein-S-isoprenylcysteine O-methyltransferase Ste14